MSTKAETTGGVTIVTPGMAALDAASTRDFKRQMAPILREHHRVVLDLSQVAFVDSSGLAAILSCLRELNAAGGDLKLCGVSAAVRTLFEMVRLHRIMDILPTREAALAAWD